MVTDQIRFDLAAFFLPLYCGLFMLGLLMVSLYRIDRNAHSDNLELLATRHAEENTTLVNDKGAAINAQVIKQCN
jgi:Na+/melibiose symporter-like transporter